MSAPLSQGWNPPGAPGVPASAPPSVLLTYGWALGAPSGVARHVQELARALALRGSRVTILCVSTASYSGFPRPALPAALDGREIEQELARLGVEVVRVAPHPLHWTLDARRVLREVERVLDTRPVDAVLGLFHEAAHLPALLGKRGIRFGYLATWLSYRLALSRERTGGGMRGAFLRSANRRMLVEPYRSADVLFANSDFTRRELVEVVGCDPARIRVTYPGVREEFHRIPREFPGQIERLLFFGRLVREKGIADALGALARIAHAGLSFRLRVLGSGNVEHVRRLVKEHRLEGRVELLPHQGDGGLLEELRQAQLAILPSHSESFGLAIAEAQAAGLPVVAYRAGSVPEVVEEGRTAWLAPTGDVRALTRCLETALMNPVESYQRGLAGRERIALNFRWDGTAERVLAGLDEVRSLRSAA